MSERLPQVRFNGFDEEWTEVRLGDVAELDNKKRKDISAKNRIHGSIPYQGAIGEIDRVNDFTHDGEYLLITRVGASADNWIKGYPNRIVSGKNWMGSHAHVLRLQNGNDAQLVHNVFSQLNMFKYKQGSAQTVLNADVLMNVTMSIPDDNSEQIKIGLFFKHYSALKDAQETRVKLLKKIKQGLLQQMLTNGADAH